MYFFFFFFSSRRRHTRWTGDWSSDVCSSDLHRKDRRMWVRQVVERDAACDGIEMANGTACDVAEPDLSVWHDRQAEWSGGDARAWGRYRPCLDPARCRIESSDSSSHCCRKPEEASSIELERLWSHWTSLHGAEWEDVKRLPRRVKAPDVVRALLDEPGVALCVYRSGHNAVLRLGRFPGRDHASA